MRFELVFRGGCELINLGSEDKSRIPILNEIDVAHTLLSRDYKGLSNYGSNGVIEIWEITEKQNV